MERLSIGQMAALNHVSVQTLRYYDKIGLLKPVFVDDKTGYRYYSINQSAKLDMIQYLKCLGMPLKTIKEQFDKEDVAVIQALLSKQICYFEGRIKELQQMKKAAEVCLRNYHRYFNAPKDGRIELQHQPQRKIFCYNIGKNLYDYLDTYEYILRELKKQVILQNLPMVYFCNAGSIIRKEMLDKEKFVSTEIFLFVDEDFEPTTETEIIPEGDYICTYLDSYWKEKDCFYRLLNHIKEKKFKIIGDYYCEVVVEFPIFHQDERNMFIKLQIPVKSS